MVHRTSSATASGTCALFSDGHRTKLLRWVTPFIPHSTFCKVGAIITPVFLREKLGYKCINNLPKIIQLSGSASGSLLLTSV